MALALFCTTIDEASDKTDLRQNETNWVAQAFHRQAPISLWSYR